MNNTIINKNKNYWHSLRLLPIFIFLSLFLCNLSFSQSLLTASGTKIVNASGSEVLLKGVNLGGWALQEGWMISADGNTPGTQSEMKKILYNRGFTAAQIESFYQSWRNNYITAPDIQFIASKGMNCVRLPMHYELFLPTSVRAARAEVAYGTRTYASYKALLASSLSTIGTDFTSPGYAMIDNLISWCSANGVYVILDMHAVPGSQGTDEHIADCLNTPNDLWISSVNQDVLNQIWSQISNRYKNTSTIAMYDLINEPNLCWQYKTTVTAVFQRLVATIRANSDNHLLMLEGHEWGNNYTDLTPNFFTNKSNLVYNLHRYGTTNSIDGQNYTWDANHINELGDARAFRTTWNVPLFCGETGCADNSWQAANITALGTVGIGYALWSYKWHSGANGLADMWAYGSIPGLTPAEITTSANMTTVLSNLLYSNMTVNADVEYWAALNSTPPTPIAVTGVTVSPTSASVYSNSTLQLTATVAPSNATNKTVTWSSSKTAVATVSSSGLVSGVSAGTTLITVTTQDGSKTATSNITVTIPVQSPYSGTAIAIPGTVEAENFDTGGETVAYHDTETANQGGLYRTTEGVDIETCAEGGYDLGWTSTGEWLEYTVNVATAGSYNIDVRVASTSTTGSFHIEFNGVDKTGIMTVPNTTDWQIWQNVTKTGVNLSAGQQIMRLYVDAAGFNLNKITISSNSSVAVTGVSVSPTSASLTIGSTQQLTATVAPTNASNKTVSWSSSNTAVATVNTSGVVTGMAAGTATITATTADGNKTATCAVTVTSSNIAVTGVILTPTTLSVATGATSTLTATVAPSNATNKAVTYTSSNTAIATVNTSGVVTGVAAGTATITVKTTDGNKTATCAVTVTSTNVAVTGVTLAPSILSVATGATSTLTATVAPSNATNKAVTYTSSNTAIATVNTSGVVTGVAAGTATITVKTTDGNKTTTCAVTVTAPVYPSIPAQIEAESYIALSGIQTETCSEGGLNVGYTSDGSWMDYGVNVTTAGSYIVGFRVSNGWTANGVFQLISGSTVLCSITVTPTGGYQTYTTLTGTVNLSAGSQILRVKVVTSPVGFNWINFALNSTVAVTAVSLAPTTLSITKGATSTLTATVTPSNATNKAVTYTSSNTAVATVSTSGDVTGVTAGTATITVKTTDGNKTATCAVTVNPANPSTFPGYYNIFSVNSSKPLDVKDVSTASGASIQQWDLSTTGGGTNQRWRLDDAGNGNYYIKVKSTQMCLALQTTNAADGIKVIQQTCNNSNTQQWTVTDIGSSNYKIINVYSGKALDVTDVSTANGALIQVWTYNGGPNQKWYFTQIETTKSARVATEIANSNATDVISIFPNPAADFIKVSHSLEVNCFEIYSLSGKLILKNKVEENSETTLNIADLKSGIYVIKTSGNNGASFNKFIKK